MASSSGEKVMSDIGHLPSSAAMPDNGDLSPTNSLQTSPSTTSVSTSLPEFAKEFSTLAAKILWINSPELEQEKFFDLLDDLASLSLIINLLGLEEITLNKEVREPLVGELKALLSCAKNLMALVRTMEEGQTPNVSMNDQIEEFAENLDEICLLCMWLGIGAKCWRDFGPGNKICSGNHPVHPRLSVFEISESLLSELEKTYERLDPIGYQQYLALIVVPGKEHETPAKECDKKVVDRMGETNDKPTALHRLHSKAPPQYTPSLASAKTAVNDTTLTIPEKNTGNRIYYETLTLQHVPAHKKQHWWMWTWCDLKVWPIRPEYIKEEWSSSSTILHPAEILGIRQRFQDAARRKMYGCGMKMEIKAGEDVERQVREDYLRDIVNRLGEKAEKTLRDLYGRGDDVFYTDDIMRRYTIEAIEAREPSGLFGGPKIMGLEESLQMKRNMEFGRRKWWKKVRDFKGKEWWLEADKVEWVVVLKIEDIDRSSRFMPSGQDDSIEGKTSVSQEVRSSVGQGEKNSSQENKSVNLGSHVNGKKDTKEEETMGVEEAERRMRILVKRLYVEGSGVEGREV